MKFETEVNLSTKSINGLIKNIKDYQKNLKDAKKYILQALSEYTQEKARFYLKMSLVHPEESTGQLSESIDIKYISDEISKVYTDKAYSAFVEFGTGVKGSQSGYDASIFPQLGNVKYNESYTGQVAHRYMYNAVQDLKKNYMSIAKRVLKERGLI